jgi:hypothetical protein
VSGRRADGVTWTSPVTLTSLVLLSGGLLNYNGNFAGSGDANLPD